MRGPPGDDFRDPHAPGAMIPSYPYTNNPYPNGGNLTSGNVTTGNVILSSGSSTGYTISVIGGTTSTFTTGGTLWMNIVVNPYVPKVVDRSWRGEVCGTLRVVE